MIAQPAPLRNLIAEQVERHPREVLAENPDGTLTYHDAWDRAHRLARALLDRGYGEGDLLATYCDNGTALLTTWLAAIALGAVFVPINGLLRGAPLMR
ncbi:MAG: AMP-binding protein, partial [Steroidobacteraceae bacterium]